jgi:hypothetical protein
MKQSFTLILLCLISIQLTNAQVGIGTTTPDDSSILDIDSSNQGLLLPRLTTAQRDAIVNPANGLIIYNTDSDELQFNSNTKAAPIWLAFTTTGTSTSTPGQSFKYSNTDTTTDVNQNSAINLPVFGTQNWNDNTSLYAVNSSNNTVTIGETGRYRIMANASIVCTASSRRAPEMYVTINGTQASAYASTGYMRRNSGHNESSLHINEVLQLSAGDVISISIVRAANSGTVTLRSTNTSNIYIEKIL